MSKRKKSPPKETLPAAENADAPAPKSALIPAVIGLAAFALAGGGAFFLMPIITPSAAEKQPAAHGEKENEHPKKNPHKKADKGHGKTSSHGGGGESELASGNFDVRGDRGIYTPEPIVVSIRPNARFRHVKIGYAVETSAESAAAFEDNELRIRDALNAYLRALDPQALSDAESFGRLRTQMARRIAFVVAPAPVHAVMITDFILS
jgi:flagellar basal body-associated protein FliL